MPIVTITTRAKSPRGNHGIHAKIARLLGVSRAAVSKTSAKPTTSARIRAALEEYQRTGRLPQPATTEAAKQ